MQETNIIKKDLSSLVFSFNATLQAIIDIEKVDTRIEVYQNTVSEYIFKDIYKPIFENSNVLISRTNPSKLHFTIERCKVKNFEQPSNISVNFKSIYMIFYIDTVNDHTRYLVVILKPSSAQTTYALILTFKDNEYMNKFVRNLLFCHNDICTTQEDTCTILHDTTIFLYYSLDLLIKTEIQEIDLNGDLVLSPTEGNVYKLRRNVPKKIQIFICPHRYYEFLIERCFGLLYSSSLSGPDNMGLFAECVLELNQDKQPGYRVTVMLYPSTEPFDLFVHGSSDDIITYTLYLDLTVKGIGNAVRIGVDIKLRIYPENEKFWLKWGKKSWKNYNIILKRNADLPASELNFVSCIEGVDVGNQIAMGQETNHHRTTSKTTYPESNFDLNLDENDVILSGTFPFDPDIPDNIIAEWIKVVETWKETRETPHNIQRLLNYGVPTELRKYVWLLLTGLYDNLSMNINKYEEIFSQESSFERVIQRDMTRTFTCHEFFKEKNGVGQQQLYRICKTYSNYDIEVGYCQGISFIIANLLLHFDELTAFSLLIHIMYKIGHRKLYIQSFDELQCCVYIFKRLIQTHAPDLARHFNDIGLEPKMFAPQWFLTLFTSKFPLGFVDLALDMYLSQGFRSLLQISLAILQVSSAELMTCNFENSLKYLSNVLPRKFSSSSMCKQLFKLAYSINFPPSCYEQLQIEFDRYKKDLALTHDPLELKRIENRMLIECQMRLEQENRMLASDLINAKIQCNEQLANITQNNIDLKRRISILNSEIEQLNTTICLLKDSETSLKNQLLNEIEESKNDVQTKEKIISTHKKQLEKYQTELNTLKHNSKAYRDTTQNLLMSCDVCKEKLDKLGVEVTPNHINNNSTDSEYDMSKRIERLEMELAYSKMNCANMENINEELLKELNEFKKSKPKKWFEIPK